ncbi:NAD-dependent epimerase/dehydratase family protein, partial [Streptomyces daliensis]|nr:NAD-dependent epimerase/dehydratase family protein [Streptomyces daliensis]
LVTGAAGFIGPHPCDRLLAEGHEVLGVDALTDTYDPALKERNAERLRARPAFTFRGEELLGLPLAKLLDDADV